MSKEEDNKAVVGRWFTEFWGKSVNLSVVDQIAAPDRSRAVRIEQPAGSAGVHQRPGQGNRVGTPLTRRPSHTTGRTDRVSGGFRHG